MDRTEMAISLKGEKRMERELEGKTALVTGGSHGIGLATSLELADQGCRIVVCSRSASRIDEAIAQLNESFGNNHIGLTFDALEQASITDLIGKVLAIFPEGIDLLINNVGGGGRWGKEDPLQTDPKVWSEVFQKNVGVAEQLSLALLPGMMRKKWGRVIAVTSIYGRIAGGRPWFGVAKHAQEAFIKGLSQNRDFVRANITFNSVAPGGIMIPDTGWEKEKENDPEEFKKRVEEQFPLGRLGTPQEVASVIAFLCSPRASLVNGASILVDGGECPAI